MASKSRIDKRAIACRLPALTPEESPERESHPDASSNGTRACENEWPANQGIAIRGVFAGLILWWTLLCSLIGCEYPTAVTAPQKATPSRPVASGAIESQIGSEDVIALSHDFRLVRPGDVLYHQFDVKNPSNDVWTIQRIDTTCSCTITTASAETVPPGGTTSFNARFRIPSTSGDKRYTMTVSFAEPGAPLVEMSGYATVRNRLECAPLELTFGGLEPGTVSQDQFQVFNYDDVTWEGLKLEPDDSWITAKATLVPREEGNTASEDVDVRQLWRVSLDCNTHGLSPGWHTSRLRVFPLERRSQTEQLVTVKIKILSPVSIIPDQLFFGKVVAGRTASARLAFHFAPGRIPPQEDAIQITHDVAAELKCEWIRTDGPFWLMAAKLTPASSSRFIEGSLQITFVDGELPDMQIPISAMVAAPE